MALKCCSLRNPNPSALGFNAPLPRLYSSSSPSFLSLRRNHPLTVSSAAFRSSPRGLCGSALLPVRNRLCHILPLAASRDDSAPLNDEYEKKWSEQEQQGNESAESWEQALAAFKEQALRLQSVSQEAYEIYSQKAMIALKETAERLQIESEKARYDLTIMVQELGEEGKQYFVEVTANSPDPVQDVLDTFATATDDVKDVSEFRDFFLGIPYGAILSFWGFLDFMVTGRTSAIRFGVILGGTLLALSVSSLKSWRKGESTDKVIVTCETVIAGILFLRQFRLLFQRISFFGLVGTFISGLFAVSFLYMLLKQAAEGSNGGSYDTDAKESNIDGEPQI